MVMLQVLQKEKAAQRDDLVWQERIQPDILVKDSLDKLGYGWSTCRLPTSLSAAAYCRDHRRLLGLVSDPQSSVREGEEA